MTKSCIRKQYQEQNDKYRALGNKSEVDLLLEYFAQMEDRDQEVKAAQYGNEGKLREERPQEAAAKNKIEADKIKKGRDENQWGRGRIGNVRVSVFKEAPGPVQANLTREFTLL